MVAKECAHAKPAQSGATSGVMTSVTHNGRPPISFMKETARMNIRDLWHTEGIVWIGVGLTKDTHSYPWRLRCTTCATPWPFSQAAQTRPKQ